MTVISTLAMLPCFFPIAPPQSCTDVRVRVAEGDAGPEGGQLAGGSLPYGASLAHGGKFAFVAPISGLSRNQAVLVSDGESLRAIAVGCGGAGGEGAPGSCGDPTPLGGTFAGFFADPLHAPAMNADGDVLFLSDVSGGPTTRGLFVYRADAKIIDPAAYIGESSPFGTVITALGPGTIDEEGFATFLARTEAGPGPANEVLGFDGVSLWSFAHVGGNGPDGPYDAVSTEFELLHDGTCLALGPVPYRTPTGRIVHFGATSTTQSYGLVLREPGQAPVWLARDHEPTPAGGAFSTFGGPAFGPNGDVFFSAQFTFGTGMRSGIFAGLPGSLRRVITSFDPIGSSICAGVDRSRGPVPWIGRAGEIVVWSRIRHADQSFGEAHVRVRANGVAEILAEPRDPAPTGGVIAELGRFPSIDASGRVLHSARIDVGPTTEAIWITAPCGTSTSFCDAERASGGCTARIGSLGHASASGRAAFFVTADEVSGPRSAVLFYGPGTASTPFEGGTLCVAPPLHRTSAQASAGPFYACNGTLSFDFGARIASGVDPMLGVGATIAAQWLIRDRGDPQGFGTQLSDAIEFTIGP